jgi:hypothetical protein
MGGLRKKMAVVSRNRVGIQIGDGMYQDDGQKYLVLPVEFPKMQMAFL